MELPKAYNPKETEDRIYQLWEESGFFSPEGLPCVALAKQGKIPEPEIFSVALPPPNATGTLHLGHALEYSLQDAIVRYQRMRGKKTLWLPGTDHAAIATNTKVEKILIKETGTNRHDIGREVFVKKVEDFVAASRGTMQQQLRQMGASLDWSREAFTMDVSRNLAVRTAFKRMYDAGLIYHGYRVINWDPKGQTAVSDDEIEYETRQTTLYTFRYSKDFPIAIASTQPETKVGDTAVAVHPDDPRYQAYIGKTFKVPFAGVELEIKVIADQSADPAFGTGALGVTPAHSIIDSEIAARHQLPSHQVIDEYGRMTELAGPLVVGKKTTEAREIIANYLRENQLIEKEETIQQNVPRAERSGGIIEPLPKLQWFIDVNKPITERGNKTLKELMREPVASGAIKIMPERFEKVYFHWIDNLRDWCISRQLWYGHRIPVWYKGEEIYVGIEPPTNDNSTFAPPSLKATEGHCKASADKWEQDPDTLDTWFSSALWTFSTLGWPDENAPDLKLYHPTSFMNPGYEILFFWVARMVLMSQFLLDAVPFHTVYLHGILRDNKGQKFSKSLANGIEPLDITQEYGTDALRMSMLVGIGPGNDGNFGLDKVKAYKHFANKIWNASKFVLANTTDTKLEEKPELTEADAKHLTELNTLVQEITADMEEYKLYLASEKLYHYFWHTFADKIIEASKENLKGDDMAAKKSSQWLLLKILTTSLQLLHPFMPFITEEIYTNLLPSWPGKQLLLVEQWPQ